MINDEARSLLESNSLAHVVTLDDDGTPHVTIAWVGLDEGDVVFGTLFDQRKLANCRRDPRVAISVETGRTNDMGLTEYLVLNGTATVIEGGAPQLLQELAYTYIGPGVEFPPMPNPPPGYVTRVKIERVGGVGPWKDQT